MYVLWLKKTSHTAYTCITALVFFPLSIAERKENIPGNPPLPKIPLYIEQVIRVSVSQILSIIRKRTQTWFLSPLFSIPVWYAPLNI